MAIELGKQQGMVVAKRPVSPQVEAEKERVQAVEQNTRIQLIQQKSQRQGVDEYNRQVEYQQIKTNLANIADMNRYLEDNIEVGNNEYVSKEEFYKLSQDDQNLLKSLGTTGYNARKEQEFKDFETSHVKLPDGNYVLKTDFDNLSDTDKSSLMTLGYNRYNTLKQEELRVWQNSHKQLGNGDYVALKEWDELTPENQKILYSKGVQGYNDYIQSLNTQSRTNVALDSGATAYDNQNEALRQLSNYKIYDVSLRSTRTLSEQARMAYKHDIYDIYGYLDDNPNDKSIEVLRNAGFNEVTINNAIAYLPEAQGRNKQFVSLDDIPTGASYVEYKPEYDDKGTFKHSYTFNYYMDGKKNIVTGVPDTRIEDSPSMARIKELFGFDSDPTIYQAVKAKLQTPNFWQNVLERTLNVVSSKEFELATFAILEGFSTVARAGAVPAIKALEIIDKIPKPIMVLANAGLTGMGAVGAVESFKKEGLSYNTISAIGMTTAMGLMTVVSALPNKVWALKGKSYSSEEAGQLYLDTISQRVMETAPLREPERVKFDSTLNKVMESIRSGNPEQLTNEAKTLQEFIEITPFGQTPDGSVMVRELKVMRANPDAYINISKKVANKLTSEDLANNNKLFDTIQDEIRASRVQIDVPTRTPQEIISYENLPEYRQNASKVAVALKSETSVKPSRQYIELEQSNDLPRRIITLSKPDELYTAKEGYAKWKVEYDRLLELKRTEYKNYINSNKLEFENIRVPIDKRVVLTLEEWNRLPYYVKDTLNVNKILDPITGEMKYSYWEITGYRDDVRVKNFTFEQYLNTHPINLKPFEIKLDYKLTPLEYEFYNIAKKQPKALLKDADGHYTDEIGWAKNTIQGIKSIVNKAGFKYAVEAGIPKEQIKLVYPEFNDSVIKSEEAMRKIALPYQLKNNMRTNSTVNYILGNQFLGSQTDPITGARVNIGELLPTEKPWKSLMATGYLEQPIIKEEKLVAWHTMVRRPQEKIDMIVNNLKEIKYEKGDWVFIPKSNNGEFNRILYTNDGRFANDVMARYSELNNEPLPVIANENPISHMADTLKGNVIKGDYVYNLQNYILELDRSGKLPSELAPLATADVGIYDTLVSKSSMQDMLAEYFKGFNAVPTQPTIKLTGANLMEQSVNLVNDIKNTVNTYGMIAAVVKFGNILVSAVYPFAFEYALAEIQNGGSFGSDFWKSITPVEPYEPTSDGGIAVQERTSISTVADELKELGINLNEPSNIISILQSPIIEPIKLIARGISTDARLGYDRLAESTGVVAPIAVPSTEIETEVTGITVPSDIPAEAMSKVGVVTPVDYYKSDLLNKTISITKPVQIEQPIPIEQLLPLEQPLPIEQPMPIQQPITIDIPVKMEIEQPIPERIQERIPVTNKTITGIIPIIPSGVGGKKKEELKKYNGRIAWKQGALKHGTKLKSQWYIISPPYKDVADIVRQFRKPDDAYVTDNMRTAVETVQSLGYVPSVFMKIDFGAFDLSVKTPSRIGDKSALKYKRDYTKTKNPIDVKDIKTVTKL